MFGPAQSPPEGRRQLAFLGPDDALELEGQVGGVGGDEVDLVEQQISDYLGEAEVRTAHAGQLFEQLCGFAGLRVQDGDYDVFEQVVELFDLLRALKLAERQHDMGGRIVLRLLHFRLFR